MQKNWLTIALKILLTIILFVGIFVLLTKNIHPKDVTMVLKAFSWQFIMEAILIVIFLSLVKTFRFYLLAKKSNLGITFWQSIKIFFASQATTPLPGGEFFRGTLLKIETGKEALTISGPVVSQALIEIISAIAIVLIGSALYKMLVTASIVLLFIVIVTFIFLFKPKWLKKIFGFIKRIPWFKKPFENVFNMQKEVQKTLLTNNRPDSFTFHVFGLGIMAHIIGGLFVFFIASAIGVSLSVLFSIFLYSATVVIQGVLGVIPGGVGVTEGGMLGLLKLWMVPVSKSVLLIILFRIGTLLFVVVLGIVFSIIFYGKYLFLRHTIKS